MNRIQNVINRLLNLDSERLLIIVLIIALAQVLFVRSILNHILDNTVKNNERKRRNSEVDFISSFLYTAYRDVIPKALLWLYYWILAAHSVSVLLIALSLINGSVKNLSSGTAIFVLVIDDVWSIIASVLIWVPGKKRPDYDVFLKRKK